MKKSEKSKLSLNKFQIAKISHPEFIVGGHFFVRKDKPSNGVKTRPPKTTIRMMRR